MALHVADQNIKAKTDVELTQIANYVTHKDAASDLAMQTASYCLMDSLGCAALALNYPACTKLLGPTVPGTKVPHGVRIPGTDYILDPVLAAFNIGSLIRWLDFNDTWLAAEWGHPSDNLGAILALGDYISQSNTAKGKPPLLVKDILLAMIKAYEIQGVIALENGFNRLGFDHVLLVKIASTAIATHMLGGDSDQIADALSQAWIDGAALRTYRHAPNTGSRKSWAAGDACSRAVRLAWMTMQGEPGYSSPLSAKQWGFYACLTHSRPLILNRKLDEYVMENVLFKISYPAEFHAQTAVEAAAQLHPQIINKIDEIDTIEIETQESAIRIISKDGELHNPADRDHCLQYMVAVALLEGDLRAEHYENNYAANPAIDALRKKMNVREDARFTKEYLDPEKRSIGNAIQITFKDGTRTDKVSIDYPIGHRRRREEGIPKLIDKFQKNMSTQYDNKTVDELSALFTNQHTLLATPISELMGLLKK